MLCPCTSGAACLWLDRCGNRRYPQHTSCRVRGSDSDLDMMPQQLSCKTVPPSINARRATHEIIHITNPFSIPQLEGRIANPPHESHERIKRRLQSVLTQLLTDFDAREQQ
eukprot:2327648-Rhodomonas_salina.1